MLGACERQYDASAEHEAEFLRTNIAVRSARLAEHEIRHDASG
jgi:hypothetical protein